VHVTDDVQRMGADQRTTNLQSQAKKVQQQRVCMCALVFRL
jgi:hypothetical protein